MVFVLEESESQNRYPPCTPRRKPPLSSQVEEAPPQAEEGDGLDRVRSAPWPGDKAVSVICVPILWECL